MSKKRRILLIIVGGFIVLLALTNPTIKDFAESCPTKLELTDDDYRVYGAHSFTHKRISNFLLFSIYEFQYVLIEKERATYGKIDSYGNFRKREKTTKRKYIGILKNFFEV